MPTLMPNKNNLHLTAPNFGCDGKLFATLPKNMVAPISAAIQQAAMLGQFSARTMLKKLQDEKINSTGIFSPLYKFLKLNNGISAQTKMESDEYGRIGRMFLGLGLDITEHESNELVPLFTAAFNPGRVWDVDKMREIEGLPIEPLSEDEAKKLFYYSLIGVSNSRGTFNGLTQKLIDQLHDSKVDFRDTILQANQLVALQSLAYNNPALVGKNIRSGIAELVRSNCDEAMLLETIEGCDPYDCIMQNRRLGYAAVFHGKSAHETLDVHLTIRRYQEFSDSTKAMSGPVIWGAPSGNDQQDFRGGAQVEVVPGADDNRLDADVYGTSDSDVLVATNGSVALFGGDGNDRLVVPLSDCSHAYSYGKCAYFLAGNSGINVYDIFPYQFSSQNSYSYDNSYDNKVFIYDANSQGRIFLKGHLLEGAVLTDVCRVSGGIDSNICWDGYKWDLDVYAIPAYYDHSTIILIDGSMDNDFAYLVNYHPWQFNLIPIDYRLAKYPGIPIYHTPGIASLYLKRETNSYYFAVLNTKGEVTAETKIDDFPDLVIPGIVPWKDSTVKIFWTDIHASSIWSISYNYKAEKTMAKTLALSCEDSKSCIEFPYYYLQQADQYYMPYYISNPVVNCSCTQYLDGLARVNSFDIPYADLRFFMTLSNGYSVVSNFVINGSSHTPTYTIKDSSGRIIGAPSSLYGLDCEISPMISYPDGSAIIMADGDAFYYIGSPNDKVFLKKISKPNSITGSAKHDRHLLSVANEGFTRKAVSNVNSDEQIALSKKPDEVQTSAAANIEPLFFFTLPFKLFQGIKYSVNYVLSAFGTSTQQNTLQPPNTGMAHKTTLVPYVYDSCPNLTKQNLSHQSGCNFNFVLSDQNTSQVHTDTCLFKIGMYNDQNNQAVPFPYLSVSEGRFYVTVTPKFTTDEIALTTIGSAIPHSYYSNEYKLDQCRSVGGSVYCESDNTILRYTPKPPTTENFFGQLDGNISLLFVAAKIATDAFNNVASWLFGSSTANHNTAEVYALVADEVFQEHITKFSIDLSKLENIILRQRQKMQAKSSTHYDSIYYLQMLSLINNKLKSSQTELSDLQRDGEAAQADLDQVAENIEDLRVLLLSLLKLKRLEKTILKPTSTTTNANELKSLLFTLDEYKLNLREVLEQGCFAELTPYDIHSDIKDFQQGPLNWYEEAVFCTNQHTTSVNDATTAFLDNHTRAMIRHCYLPSRQLSPVQMPVSIAINTDQRLYPSRHNC